MSKKMSVTRRIWQGFKGKVYIHLVLPFQESHAPIWHIARGTAIGLFIGLTPTVGVQMYIAALVWGISRYVFGFRFNLPIAVAMVWISNPVTFLPMYYGYLVTGHWIMVNLGHPDHLMTFETFRHSIEALSAGGETGFFAQLVNGLYILVVEFGWPMVLGSLVYAIPLGMLGYPLAIYTMIRYRHHLAENSGMSYQEWKQRYVTMD